MPWWEAQLRREIAKLNAEELRTTMAGTLEVLNDQQALAMAAALKVDLIRRGLIKPAATRSHA